MPASNQTAPVRRRTRAALPSPLAVSFHGTWKARRKIVDHLAAATSFFEGTASVTPDRFQEDGHLTLGGSRLHATRVYRLHTTPHGINVSFPDGSAFIALTHEGSQKVRHVCGADTYVGHFFFVDPATWIEAWRVTGPRKRYTSLTRYTALPPQAAGDGRPETGA